MTDIIQAFLPHFPNLALLTLAMLVISFLTIVSGSDEADARDGHQESQPIVAKTNLMS